MERDWKSIVISDLSLGLTPKFWTNIRESRSGKNGEHTEGSTNPFIYPGYLSPGSSSHTAVTNNSSIGTSSAPGTNSDTISKILSVDDNNNSATNGISYYVGAVDKLVAMSSPGVVVTSAPWPHTVIGSISQPTSQFDVTLTGGTTYRYTWDGTGTDPKINATSIPVGTQIFINSTTFNVNNRGAFTVTGSGTNYFEVTNAAGVAESNIVTSNNGMYAVSHWGGSSHGSPFIHDVVEYQINGNRRVFYFFTDGVDGDAGILNGSNIVYSENAFSTATGGFSLGITYPIIPVPADNSFMYVAQESAIHKFDGTTDGGSLGTVTANVVKIQNNRMIVDMVDGLGKMWIATKPKWANATTATAAPTALPSRNVSVVVWNRTSTIVAMDNDIPITDCSDIYSIFFHRGVPWVFTLGPDQIIQLRKYDGRKFVVVQEVGRGEFSRPANRWAVTSYNNGILWQTRSGDKYWYGTLEETLSNDFTANADDQLFKLGGFSTAIDSGAAGAIFRPNSTNILCGHRTSSVNSLSSWSPTSTSQTISTDEFAIPYIELPQNAIVHGIKLLFLDFTTGSGISSTVTVTKNATGSESASFSIDHDIDGKKGYYWMPLKWRDTNRIMFRLQQPSTTIDTSLRLYRIEVYYTPASKTL